MTDDDLRDELERRSKSVNLPREWSRHDLLPVVSSGIDSRPQRVATSRGPALAGLAAVVAIVVVLVVALPRIPPSPASTNGAVTTGSVDSSATIAPAPVVGDLRLWSPTDFASAVAAGQLRGSKVIVYGRIDPMPLRRPCVPVDECLLGGLAGIPVFADWVATLPEEGTQIDRGPDAWHWWTQPATGEIGPKLLSVYGDGHVVFLGNAAPPDSGVTWTVDEMTGIEPGNRAVDQMFIVNGWLTETEPAGTTITIDCMMPSATPVPGLPTRYCQPGDRLSNLQVDPAVGDLPDGGVSMPVQRDAAQVFGRGQDSSHGFFAVSPRLYSGCLNEAPCFQWDVVARLDDSAPTQASPPPNTSTIECSPEPDPTVDGGLAPWHATLHDETGLVESCEGIVPVDIYLPVLNLGDDPRVLQLNWDGRPCDAEADVTFSPLGDAYHVRGILFDDGRTCDDSLVTHALLLHLREDVDASQVLSQFDRHAPPPDSTPSPIASDGKVVECPGKAGTTAPSVTLLDHTGHVVECSTRYAGAFSTIDAAVGGPSSNQFYVTWDRLGNCDPTAQAELWRLSENFEPSAGARPAYQVHIAQSEPSNPCDGGGEVSLIVKLDVPLAEGEVGAFLTREVTGNTGMVEGIDRVPSSDGILQLVIQASTTEFVADQPIDVVAMLDYAGSRQSVTVAGGPTPQFGIEQLDGDLYVDHAPHVLTCPRADTELVTGKGITVNFTRTLPIAADEPFASFYQQYMYDGQLRLPAGTYRLYADSTFSVGSGCGSLPLPMHASIVIHVR